MVRFPLGFGHTTTKTWAYSTVYDFFKTKHWPKKRLPPPKSLFKNTMGTQLFFLNIDPNA